MICRIPYFSPAPLMVGVFLITAGIADEALKDSVRFAEATKQLGWNPESRQVLNTIQSPESKQLIGRIRSADKN